MTAGLRPAEFWAMGTDETVLVIEGHKRRRDEWDELLANLAKNIVAPPISGKGKSARLKTDER